MLIYSVGRTGSTLLSKAFGALGTVCSLSEPDIYTQAVWLRRSAGGARDDEMRALLASSTRLLLAPVANRQASVGVLKFRSLCIEIGDLLGQAFPQARNLFLYRDLAAWLPSAAAMFGIFEEDAAQWLPGLIAAFANGIPLLAARLQEPGEPPTAWSLWPSCGWPWCSATWPCSASGAWFALRYEDLVDQPAPASAGGARLRGTAAAPGGPRPTGL